MDFILRFLGASHAHQGLLIIRVALGCTMLPIGWGKLSGGPEMWAQVGGAMAMLGVDFAPTFWGFCAALSEFLGALLLMIGLFSRPAAAGLAFTMFVAMVLHLNIDEPGKPMHGHALNLMLVYLALFIAGPGKFSLDEKIFGGMRRKRQAAPADATPDVPAAS